MELIDYFERVRERTMRVIGCIPAGKVDWTYREGKYTFGDVIRHLGATERWMFAENALLRPSRYPGHGRDLAATYEDAVAYIVQMHEESMSIFRSLTPDQLEARCSTPGGTPIRVSKWLRLMSEHEIHHRGQLYVYLGILDIPAPPLYGLTEEEMKARSAR